MTRSLLLRRRTVVLVLLITSLVPPFFSERPQRPSKQLGEIPCHPAAGGPEARNIETQRLLLSPFFPIQFMLMTGVLLTVTMAIVDLSLRLVYTACKLGVERVTVTSLSGNCSR